MCCEVGVVGFNLVLMRENREVKKQHSNRKVLERPTKEGDSPVDERMLPSWIEFPSTAGHGESCGNLGGPPPKAKYSLVTDSEPVP